LHWPDVESAISLCFLGYLDWHKSKKTGTYLFGKEPADRLLAKQLSGAIYQGTHKIHGLFYGENPKNQENEPDVTHLVFPSVPGINKSGRNKSKPLMLAISETFLPPDCVEVYWDRDDTGQPSNQLAELNDLQSLAHLIRESHGLPQIPKSQISADVSPDTVLLSAKAQTMDSMDFEAVAGILREADGRVIKSIRDHNREFFSEKELAQEHADLLEVSLRKGGFELSEFLTKIQDIRFLERLSGTVKPHLQVQVGEIVAGRFKSICFTHDQKVLLTLKDTDLLWPCWCRAKITDAENCPIHSSKHGQEVANRFQHGMVEISWRGFRFLWKNGRESWPPSIDAFIFIETLEKAGVFRTPGNTLLDAGSGTGFLAIIAAHCIDTLAEITLWDWLLTPALYGQVNWYRNLKNDHLKTQRDYVTARTMVGLFHDQMPQQRPLAIPFDFVLCNPPYLPIPAAFKKLTFESTTTGTQLLEHVITNSARLGKNVYLQFSKLAEVEAKSAADQNKLQLLPAGPVIEIPCRIRDAINNADYLKYLQRPERGLRRKGTIYTQKIRAYKIVPVKIMDGIKPR